jgi:hypothetical protein
VAPIAEVELSSAGTILVVDNIEDSFNNIPLAA